MKKILCVLLVFTLCAGLIAGCGTGAAPDAPGSVPAADGPDLEACLKDLAEQNPDADADALAEKLLENPYFKRFVAENQDLQNGELPYFPALNGSFTGEGLKDAACIWDAFGSRAIVYVFTPEPGTDAAAILDAAENAVDPYWSETPFDHQLALATGGRAFFALYNDGMEPVTGEIAVKAEDFVDMFHTLLKEDPDASAQIIAEYMTSHQKVTAMQAIKAEPGALTGFGDYENAAEVTGFAEGAGLIPDLSPNPFIGYVFRLDDGADTAAFVQMLKEKANPAWNVCIRTNTVITETDGSAVLFMMCNQSAGGQ